MTTPFSQNDPRWADKKIGESELTIGNYGCYLVSLAMIADIPPDELNYLLTERYAYTSSGLIINYRAYESVGLIYKGKTYEEPGELCIGSTNMYMPKLPRHFFVKLPDGAIIDPLDGKTKFNKYSFHIVDWRIFKNSKEEVIPNVPT